MIKSQWAILSELCKERAEFWCSFDPDFTKVMSKGCCNNAPVIWTNKQWECSECGSNAVDMNNKPQQLDMFGYITPRKDNCEHEWYQGWHDKTATCTKCKKVRP